jgi:transcriptional regulator with XRE-family HTH domain
VAFASVKISGKKLFALVEKNHFNVSEFARAIGVTKEAAWRYMGGDDGQVVGVKPEIFRKMLEVLHAEAAAITANGEGRTDQPRERTIKISAELYGKLERLADGDIAEYLAEHVREETTDHRLRPAAMKNPNQRRRGK